MNSIQRFLVFMAFTSLLLCDPAPAQDWPTWRGTDGTGVSNEVDWDIKGRSDVLWSKNVGLGYSTVVVGEGRLLTVGFDEEKQSDTIHCLDALTGEAIWTHSVPAQRWNKYHGGGTLSTPVIDGDTIYILNREGKFLCLQASDGAVLWQKDLMEAYDLEYPEWMFSASPLVMTDKVIVNVGRVLALDKKTGETIWKTRDTGHAYSTPALMNIGGRDHLAVFNGEGLVVMDTSKGREIASYPWKTKYDVNAATPIVIGNRIFISSGYNHGCAMLELTDEGLVSVWESKEMRSQLSGCVLFNGHLYGFDDKVLKCLDTDGNEQWAKRGLGQGALMIADGKLIVMSGKGELIIADASPGGFSEMSRQKVLKGGVYWSTPILANGLIYCRNSLGDLVCRDHRGDES